MNIIPQSLSCPPTLVLVSCERPAFSNAVFNQSEGSEENVFQEVCVCVSESEVT